MSVIAHNLRLWPVFLFLLAVFFEIFREHRRLLRRLSQAEEESRQKSAFVANVNHELRTPLNGILGMMHLALETELTEKQRDYLQTAQGLSSSLLKIINDTLDLCKIEAGKMTLDPVLFEPRVELGGVVRALFFAAREKGLNLRLDIAGDVPCSLIGDSLRLNQVLLNVVSNAVKFTERGDVHLSVAVRPPAHSGRCELLFVVTDTGIGMPAATLQKIFEPFTQADRSTTRNYGGTGLGLTICSKFVRMLGGKIWIESQPKVGTKVSFTAVFDLPPCEPALQIEQNFAQCV